MVLIRPDNSAVTVIRSESELQNDPGIVDCRTDFRQMCKALTHERILRLDTRGPEQIATRLRVGEAEDEKYFSLGTDAIAVALSKWGATRKIARSKKDFIRRYHQIKYELARI